MENNQGYGKYSPPKYLENQTYPEYLDTFKILSLTED